MKILIHLIIGILLCSVAFATVSRSGSGNQVTYSTDMATTYSKAYWAVDELPSSCSITSVTCSATNADCNYVGGAIRVVGYTASGGGSMPSSITVTVSGSGSCTLNSGNYVESYNDGTAHLGSSTALSGSITLSLDGGGSCPIVGDTAPACDGIKISELGSVAQSWINAGGPTGTLLNNLASAAQDWINHGGPV